VRSIPVPSRLARTLYRDTSTDRHARLIPFLIVLWVALALITYRHVIGTLIYAWQTHPSYSHGPIVIPIAIWLLWHRRSTRPEVSPPWVAGCGMLAAAHFLLWLGEHFYLPAIQLWTIPLWLGGMISMLWGRATLLWSLPAICFLAFMIPVPFQLEMLANQLLQWTSAWCSCFFLSLGSIVAVTDGYTLRMSSGRVAITADCSGLRMTVAIAALGYVITLLSRERFRANQSNAPTSLSIVLHLCGMMLLVIPAAIVANAARIALMALVVNRYQQESYRSWAHDLGDWLVLPVAAVMFLILAAWTRSALETWRIAMRELRSDNFGLAGRQDWKLRYAPFARTVAVPLAIVLIAFASILNYHSRRGRLAERLMAAGRTAESQADWDRAAACYQELIYLDASPEDARFRHALVSQQAATSEEDQQQVMLQLEAILARFPFHMDALRTHLDMALELDAPAALQSSQRLYSLKCHDAATLQMCITAMLRFHPDPTTLPLISVDSINGMVEKLGPASGWRNRFLLEIAELSCRYPDSVDPALTEGVSSAISKATSEVGSAEAYYRQWNFDRLLGDGEASLDPALARINDNCSPQTAYLILQASATEAWRDQRLDQAKEQLQQALRLRPQDHRGYELLGDVSGSAGEWVESEEAYLRAWQLAENRSLELGIKLADAMFHAQHDAASAGLVNMLAAQIAASDVAPRPALRMRLQLVHARLALRNKRYQEALQQVELVLAAWSSLEVTPTDQLLATVETLQAQCLVRLGRYADAARLFESRASRTDRADDSGDQWRAAARAWRTAGNAAAAQRCYRNAVLRSADRPEVWLEYVHLLKDSRGTSAAKREVLSLSNRLDAGSPSVDKTLAQAWEIVGDSARAIQHYRLAAQGEPQQFAALAIALARRGDAETAVRLVRSKQWPASVPMRAHTAAMVGVAATDLTAAAKDAISQIVTAGVATAKDDVTLLLAAAEWLAKCQAASEAMKLLQRAIVLQPDNVVAANNLAMLLADSRNDFDQAMKHIDGVLERSGPVAEFLDTKGWILVLMDRAQEALPFLNEAARRRNTNDPIAQLHLATAYLATGDRDHALEHLQRVTASQLRPETMNSGERRALSLLLAAFGQSQPGEGKGDA
jgi:exosortase